jgi:hypothetical protein
MYTPIQVFLVALKIKKKVIRIKKGIIEKYSRIITTNNIRDCGITEG